MEVQTYIIYCLFISSSNAFALLPSSFYPKTTIMQNEAQDTLSSQSGVPVHSKMESASTVLPQLKSMTDFPCQDATEYTVEKAKELAMSLEHNANKVVSFTLGGVDSLIDLVRLQNVKLAKSLMEYFGAAFTYFTSLGESWFVTSNEKTKQDRKPDEKNNTTDSANFNSIYQVDETIAAELSENGSEIENTNLKSSIKPDPSNESENHSIEMKTETLNSENHSIEMKTETLNSMLSENVMFTLSPKELSVEEKNDVEKARQQIIIIQNAINELENEMKQNTSDDREAVLKYLKDQAEMKKKFVKLSTSEHIR